MAAGAAQTIRWSGRESGGEVVAVMQTVNLRSGDDLPDPVRGGDRVWVGAILVEGKMGTGSMVVVDVPEQDAAQMPLVEDADVIQTFAPSRTDHALDVSAWRGD